MTMREAFHGVLELNSTTMVFVNIVYEPPVTKWHGNFTSVDDGKSYTGELFEDDKSHGDKTYKRSASVFYPKPCNFFHE